MDSSPPIIVYFDDQCPACQASVRQWQEHDRDHQLVFRSCRTDESRLLLGEHAEQALDRIHVTRESSIYSGVSALLEIYRRLPSRRYMLWLLLIADRLGVAEPFYNWFARNRMLFRRRKL